MCIGLSCLGSTFHQPTCLCRAIMCCDMYKFRACLFRNARSKSMSIINRGQSRMHFRKAGIRCHVFSDGYPNTTAIPKYAYTVQPHKQSSTQILVIALNQITTFPSEPARFSATPPQAQIRLARCRRHFLRRVRPSPPRRREGTGNDGGNEHTQGFQGRGTCRKWLRDH